EFPTELFQRQTVERLAGHFTTLVRDIVRNPKKPLAELELLLPEEKGQLLESFNDTAHALPEVTHVHELFEGWAAKTPDAVALVFGKQSWTYDEVNRQANRVATWLLGLGIKKDDFVAILLDPCAEQLAAMLGALKAGAAFLPIDAEYPVGRKEYMLSDSAAK